MRLCTAILIAMISSKISLCQPQSHYGKEFYFGMPHNYPSQCTEISLDIASKQTGNYTFSVPFINRSERKNITKGVTTIKLPCRITDEGNFIAARGIHLETNVDAALYATNFYKSSAESFLVLPANRLGKSYFSAGYKPTSGDENNILITAIENGTHFSIYDSIAKKSLQNSTINKFEVSQFSVVKDLKDITITSDKPVSVITGTSCTNIPEGVTACDMITEQMIPTESLDSIYIVPPTPPKEAYELRVTSSLNNSVCFFNDTKRHCGHGSTISLRMGNSPTVVVSSHPVAVFQYGYGNAYPKTGVGDPFMTVVPGLRHFLNEYYFVIPDAYANADNYISIIIETESIAGLILDGSNITRNHIYNVSKPFQNYTVLIQQVTTTGYHILRHTNNHVNFGLLVYGVGARTETYVGFGYPGGLRLSADDAPSFVTASVLGTFNITLSKVSINATEMRSTTPSTSVDNVTYLDISNFSTGNKSLFGIFSTIASMASSNQMAGEDLSTTKKSTVGVILGTVFGSLCAIALVSCFLFLLVGRKRMKKAMIEPDIAEKAENNATKEDRNDDQTDRASI